MKIELNSLRIENFKGIKNLLVEPKGQNLKIYGNNATGKTTIMDSFLWLIFNKDSNDSTKFTVKPQDDKGNDIHHLQTVVEAELLVDGQPLKVKKMQEEKWVKSHGATERVFDGHDKKYWWNEVPTKATEYKNKIDDLINENIFKMITDPLFFNTKIDWKARRETLLEISGDKTNEEVIASDKTLSKLTELLNGRSIDDYKLVLADQLNVFKKERGDIPPRIDELTRALPQVEPDYTEVEKELESFKNGLSHIESQLTNITNANNEINKKYQNLAKLKNELSVMKTKIELETGADRKKLTEEKAELENGRFTLESNIKTLQAIIKQSEETIEANAIAREQLIAEWKNLNAEKAACMAEEFIEPEEGSFNCPTCRQALSEEDKVSKLAEMKERFEQNKQSKITNTEQRLELNVSRGQQTKTSTEKEQKTIEESKAEVEVKEKALVNIAMDIQKIETELLKPASEVDYTKSKEIYDLSKQIDDLCHELDKPIEGKSSGLLQRKAQIQSQINECSKILNSKAETEKKVIRIKELREYEHGLSIKIARLEGNKYLLERFTVAKVNLLEDSINNQFEHVKFKLFEENVTNEGIKETCIALVNTNGSYIKFEDANSAGKINAGLDIINSLTKFYGVSSTIWIDNRESVVELADTDSQVISLIVSEPDKELRVEVQE